ncbi:MAG TPA: gamma-glutamyl-gamma-aminobutyrate hydrolase family protein [Nitrospiria bacterium]|nr:gamma-glutamyl-gamma-aminobutyrate hydrolase family protein [Nitrospiria bacterium]
MRRRSTQPIIGVTSDFNAGDKDRPGGREPTYFLRARYVQAIEAAGGLPLILPITDHRKEIGRLLDLVDGLLLTGSGPDLDPKLYNETKRYRFKVMSRERTGFELALARQAWEREVPTLGICGGMQLLNVAAGGSLYQDLPGQLKTLLKHQQQAYATEPSHWVEVEPGTKLREIVKAPKIRVNSSHHQGVKSVSADLVVNARAEDGVIEGIEAPDHPFLVGVQWHPEFLYTSDPISRKLFTTLLAAAGRRR